MIVIMASLGKLAVLIPHVNQGGCLKDDLVHAKRRRYTRTRGCGHRCFVRGMVLGWRTEESLIAEATYACGDGVVFGERVRDGRCMRMRMESSSLQKRGGRGPVIV